MDAFYFNMDCDLKTYVLLDPFSYRLKTMKNKHVCYNNKMLYA